MGERGQAAAVVQVARPDRGECLPGGLAVLHVQEFVRLGHEVDARLVGDVLLGDRQRPQRGGHEQELGQVGSPFLAREATAEQQPRDDLTGAVPGPPG